MADSLLRLTSPPKRSKRGVNKRPFVLSNIRRGDYKDAHEKEDPKDLPRWVKLALTEYTTIGGTYAEIAEKYDRSVSQLSKYANSPAGKKWRAEVLKIADSPEQVAMSMIRASAANVALDYMMALQGAIDAGDYREIGVMSRDLLDRLGLKKQTKENASKPTLVINVGAGGLALDMPQVQTSAKEVVEVDADWELVEDKE